MRLQHLIIAASLLGGADLVSPSTRGESPATDRGGVASLEERLKSGLKVKAPRDVKFVDTVVERVREGRLPEKVVDATYFWAIGRGKRYPFPAFEHVMRMRAEKLNVPL